MYFIFAFIDCLTFSPITCAKYTDYVISESEPNREDAATHLAKAVVPLFLIAVTYIFSDDTVRVSKSVLGFAKRDPVLSQVLEILT